MFFLKTLTYIIIDLGNIGLAVKLKVFLLEDYEKLT